MSDIIQLLPDSVANQIAAGEVIQRPASVVKELVENAIDAGATEIKINIKDAGKTLIQIIDNGCGMSETDARLAFERHATSKIKKAEDLFAIRSMGFRGEALASIAAIADVDLKTRHSEQEVGTHIHIKGSEVITQEPVSCAVGSNFSVKSLFFNIPARRKFLKTNTTEFKHITNEFQRVALAHPEIVFYLYHNNVQVHHLPVANIRQRIINLFGSHIKQKLIPVKTETSIAKINGFVAKPQYAKKSKPEQFFFVNNRFMRHPYFHKAAMLAYEKIIQPETAPAYFIYFDIEPEKIDINIHPTKTEIKFEEASAIFQILRVCIKESFGKHDIMASIEFDQTDSPDIPVMKNDTEISTPTVSFNPDYNPFEENEASNHQNRNFERQSTKGWEQLYEGMQEWENEIKQNEWENSEPAEHTNIKSKMNSDDGIKKPKEAFYQFKQKYIITSVKSGLMIIDQKRACERILFEKYMYQLSQPEYAAEQSLFSQNINFEAEDFAIIMQSKEELQKTGFDFEASGEHSILLNSTPAQFDVMKTSVTDFFENLVSHLKENELERTATTQDEQEIADVLREKIALSLAQSSAIGYGKSLTNDEMQKIVYSLLACEMPNYTPGGKMCISILQTQEIEKRF